MHAIPAIRTPPTDPMADVCKPAIYGGQNDPTSVEGLVIASPPMEGEGAKLAGTEDFDARDHRSLSTPSTNPSLLRQPEGMPPARNR